MNRFSIVPRFTVASLGCLLLVMMAQAQQSSGEPEEMFRQLDANKDGKLTLGEGGPGSQQFLRRLFEMANKKDSESISRDELRRLVEQHRRGQTGGNPASQGNRPTPRPTDEPVNNAPAINERSGGLTGLLRVLDANRDGKLSRAELNRIAERFADWDRNKDGQLDADELQTLESDSTEGRSGNESPTSDPSRRPASSTPRRTGSSSGGNPADGSNGHRPTTAAVATGPINAALQTRLAGTWRGWVVDGRGENPNAGHMQMELQVSGNRMVGREVGSSRAPEGLGDGTFTIAGTGNTGTLDAVSTSGQHNGREYPGIFEIDGDTLRWCVNNRNGTRPTSFETNRGNYFMILRKQK